jgi:hypothetical protein
MIMKFVFSILVFSISLIVVYEDVFLIAFFDIVYTNSLFLYELSIYNLKPE